jgi:tape measure domain-containing protein
MAASVDDKVVAMSFESSKFESGVHAAISALEKLKSALHFPGAGKGLDDINAAGKRIDLSHIAQGIDGVKSALSSLRLVGVAVLANIASAAVRAGASFVKSFTLGPVLQGFQEYSTNLNAVQTILANTQASGAKLKDVNAALAELNTYSDKTIYNFSEMAKNIGTFTAAGVDLKTATGSIKGIANLAALSGSNSQQASTAMYQLSQAISAGRVSLQDWNSVVNAGMGGTVFQRALAQTAEAMGTLDKGTVKLTGSMKNVSIHGQSFRESITAKPGEKSWLTSDVLTKTLQQFTGDLSNAQLKAQGFNDAQIASIQQTAKTAQHAATEVKTIAQVFDVAKETAGSGWAKTFQLIFGDFGEAKKTFTSLSNVINGFINTSADARNKVLSDWKELGGRTVLLDGIKVAFHNLGLILAPIKEAFREIFPPKTGQDLFDLTQKFHDFASALKPSKETVDNLKSTFKGFFALLDIGKMVIGGIFTVIGKLFGAMNTGQGGFLSFTATIGDWIVALRDALKDGDRLHNFFAGLGEILAAPIKILMKLKDALSNLFGGFSSGGISGQMSGMTNALTPFQKVVEAAKKAWDSFVDSIHNADISGALAAIGDAFSGIGTAIGNALSNMNFEVILAGIRTGLLAGLVLMLKSFFGKGSLAEQLGGMGGGIFESVAGSFKALQGSMVAMQNNIKADTLQKIAIAVGVLAASIVALSFVSPERLQSSLSAITVAFGELLGAMAILDKIGKSGGFVKMPFIAGSMILLAAAIDILAIAVIALAQLSWDELIRGLTGVTVLLAGLAIASGPLSANSAGMIRAGVGITAIAIGLRILASAVAAFASMSWQDLGKGLIGVGVGLGILAVGMKAMPPSSVLSGAGLVITAAGLKILASAVKDFGSLDWNTMGKGLAGIAGSLIIVAAAMQAMPVTLPITAAGLVLVSIALGKISSAVATMGGMSVEQIAKGLITLAGSLTILAVALNAMSSTFAGAAALGIAAAGLSLLVPAIVALGSQSWETIIKGLITLAAAITILGIAGLLLAPVVPALIGFGAALLLIGGGLALAGVGIALIGVGLSAIAVSGTAAIGILVAAFNELLHGIITNTDLMIKALLGLVQGLAKAAPDFVAAMVTIVESLLDVVIKSTPKMVKAFQVLLDAALGLLKDNQSKIIQAGFELISALLTGIQNNLPGLIKQVADIVVKFLTGISQELPKIITAGADVLVNFLKGIAQNITDVVTAATNIITKFLGAIASNLGKIVVAGGDILVKVLEGIAKNIGNIIEAGVDVIVAFIKGVGNAGSRIVTAGTNAIIKLINALSSNAVKLADAGMKAIISFLNGVATAIDANAGEMRAAGWRVGVAVIDGMTGGLASKAGALFGQLESIASKAKSIWEGAKGFLSRSPSVWAENIGLYIMQGFSGGIDSNTNLVYSSMTAMSNGVIGGVKKIFGISSPSTVMKELGQFVGQGFAQGLRSSGEDIRGAFSELNQKLTEAMSTARQTIIEEQKKLKELREADKPDAEAIREAQKIIDQNQDLLIKSTAAHKVLTQSLKDEKAELVGLSGEFERVGNKLKAAQDILNAAIKTRNDAVRGFTSQYSKLPAIVTEDAEGHAIDQLANYEEALKHEADAVAAYHLTLEQLRKLGLDDATYQKLLDEGTMDQAFADQLLAGGKTAVDALNVLDANLAKVSKTLATNAGKNLYQAGVDAAGGIVKGLQSKKNALENKIEDLAKAMVAALKKELKIKSPSEVFAEVGGFAIMGMVEGLFEASPLLSGAVRDAMEEALKEMKKSAKKLSSAISNEMNFDPVITPVLDLTKVRMQNRELTDLVSENVTPITAAASYNQAASISANTAPVVEDLNDVGFGRASVRFEQNNYSPVALSEIEIYRQTKNQLSQFKSVLEV